MEETVTSFEKVFTGFYHAHEWWEIALLFWNFIGSISIVVLSFWRLQDINNKVIHFTSKLAFYGVKASLVLIGVGAFFHSLRIEVPSFREGCIYSGVLIYLFLRRRKQINDKKNSII